MDGSKTPLNEETAFFFINGFHSHQQFFM